MCGWCVYEVDGGGGGGYVCDLTCNSALYKSARAQCGAPISNQNWRIFEGLIARPIQSFVHSIHTPHASFRDCTFSATDHSYDFRTCSLCAASIHAFQPRPFFNTVRPFIPMLFLFWPCLLYAFIIHSILPNFLQLGTVIHSRFSYCSHYFFCMFYRRIVGINQPAIHLLATP